MMRPWGAAATGRARRLRRVHLVRVARGEARALRAEDATRTLLLHRVGRAAPAGARARAARGAGRPRPPSRGNYPIITTEVLDALIARVGGLDAGPPAPHERASGASTGAERRCSPSATATRRQREWLGAATRCTRRAGRATSSASRAARVRRHRSAALPAQRTRAPTDAARRRAETSYVVSYTPTALPPRQRASSAARPSPRRRCRDRSASALASHSARSSICRRMPSDSESCLRRSNITWWCSCALASHSDGAHVLGAAPRGRAITTTDS